MPRATARPLCYLALSPNACAVALGLHIDRVLEAVRDGKLHIRVSHKKHRILISEIEKWVRSWPEHKLAKRKG